jgi:superfamily I DNA/RNA helicase
LESELDWIKDQVPMTLQVYLEVERHGRGFRLTSAQREQMWSAVFSYQKKLRQSGDADWADIPRIIWKAIKESTIRLPIYDVVMVDEAQFFAPIWFDVIRHLIRPQTGHLFIVADPGQGFLGRGTSWKSLGLDVRGHTHKLRHSYRTTHEILNFVTLFYRQRITEDDLEEEVLPPDLLNMPHGIMPFLIPLPTSQDEITRVALEIEGLIKRGQSPDTILVLHADWEGVEDLIDAICKRLGEKVAADPKNELPGDYVRVTTINAGTGLESPIVFLVGLNTMFEKEQSLRFSDDEREKIKLENTRKIYMAATRAGQRLIFTYVGSLPDPLKGLLNRAD